MGISKNAITFKAADENVMFIDFIRQRQRPIPSRSAVCNEFISIVRMAFYAHSITLTDCLGQPLLSNGCNTSLDRNQMQFRFD